MSSAAAQQAQGDVRAAPGGSDGGRVCTAPRHAPGRARRPEMYHPDAPASDPAPHGGLDGRHEEVGPAAELDVQRHGDMEAEVSDGPGEPRAAAEDLEEGPLL
eukprot:5528276-Lingulodinium_polyedra.AAC.1